MRGMEAVGADLSKDEAENGSREAWAGTSWTACLRGSNSSPLMTRRGCASSSRSFAPTRSITPCAAGSFPEGRHTHPQPRMDRGWQATLPSGRIFGRNRGGSAPTCGSRDVGVAAPASRPTAAQSQPILLGEPVAWQRFWLTSPTHGRVPGTVMQVAGGGKPKTRENRPLQPKPGGVKTAVMQQTGSSAVGSRWPIIPKWEDRQVFLITCSVQA